MISFSSFFPRVKQSFQVRNSHQNLAYLCGPLYPKMDPFCHYWFTPLQKDVLYFLYLEAWAVLVIPYLGGVLSLEVPPFFGHFVGCYFFHFHYFVQFTSNCTFYSFVEFINCYLRGCLFLILVTVLFWTHRGRTLHY